MEAGSLPPMPTAEDVKAMFDRATQAAQRAETAAQRLEAAQTAAGKEAEERFPGMPAELVEQVSRATAQEVVQALNSQYELAGSSGQPASPSPQTPPNASIVSSATTSGTPPAPGPTSSESPPANPAAPDPSASKPRNLAHRILGY